MTGESRFDRLLAGLYEAMLDDARWPAASALIDEVCGSKGNMMVSGDGGGEDVDIFFARFCYRGERRPDLGGEYFEVYYPLDERVPRLRQLPDSRVVHVDELYTEEEKKSSPVYNEMLEVWDIANGVNARLDGPNGSRIAWGSADPVDGEGWSSARVATLGRVLPHVRQYVRVRHALVEARALGASATALLENTRCSVIHLDARGRIAAVNDAARTLLRTGDGIGDEDGFLRASSEDDDARLQRVLARALPRFGGQGESGSTTVKRASVAPRLAVHVCPAGEPDGDVRSSGLGALVLVVDPLRRVRLDPELVSAAFGLSPAESRVAALLVEGHSIREIATATGRSYNTIRWHVKHMLARQGVSRQAELVRLVLSLSDIPAAKR